LPKSNFSLKQINEIDFNNAQALYDQLPQSWHPDLVFIDSYRLQKDYQIEVRKFSSNLAVLDDMPWREHDAEILIDPTLNRNGDEYKNLVPAHTRLLNGTKYAPLRAEFAQARKERLGLKKDQSQHRKRKHIVVSLGLTDPDNVTATVLEGLLKVSKEFDVTALISFQSPFEQEIELLLQQFKFGANVLRAHSDMAGLLSGCDLVIGAGGSSSWERCCMGVPALQLILADNQKDVTENLVKIGAIQSLGHINDFSPELVTNCVESLLADDQNLISMSTAALGVCDGLGASRIADCAESLRS
jgi:UDP-2,4-diacetamido-2,4,6-trideoxy-beta-L-altropyranose hydrolase